MPSILAKLGLKRSQPKVFSKAFDNVKKTLRPGRKAKKYQQEIVVAQEPVIANSDINDGLACETYEDQNSSNNFQDHIDLTNSVMINKLAALEEDSLLERQEEDEVDESMPRKRDDSMATFLEDEDDSLLEEKAERPPSSSPINVLHDPMEHSEMSEAPRDREESNAMPAPETTLETSDPVIERARTISEPVAEVKPAPVEVESAKIVPHVEKEVATVAAPERHVNSQVPSKVASSFSKNDVLETLKRNASAPRESSTVGNLRARFENASSKAPTPTLKSVLAARNTAKFAKREEVVAPAVNAVEEAKPEAVAEPQEVEVPPSVVEATQVLETKPVEVAKAVVAINNEVEVEDQVKTTLVSEPAIIAVPQAVVSARTELLASGDEKALLSAMLEIAAKPYKEQATWFLNAYWNELFEDQSDSCERVWRFCNKFVELDAQGAKGCELDELRAHRVLEVLAEALTFTEMRTKFHRRAKHVSLIELLIFVFSADWMQVVMAPQGSDAAMEQMQQAESLMAKSSAALEDSKVKASGASEAEKRAAETAKQALASKNEAIIGENMATDAEARAIEFEKEASCRAEEASQAFEAASLAAQEAARAEAETVKRAEECARAEQEARAGQEQATAAEKKAVDDERCAREAESEAFRREQSARESEQSAVEAEKCLIDGQARVEAALNKVKEEEAAFQKLLEDLKEKSENTSIGIVARRTANHEREVLLAKNPDPLCRARIAEEAVVRKHEKLIRQAAAARAAASAARTDSEVSRDRAVKSRIASEATRSEAAIRRSASETKAAAAVEARTLSEAARESATKAREESDMRRKASDEALESARKAKESASQARLLASQERETAGECKLKAEHDEQQALAAKELASQSREKAEEAVEDAIRAFERARHFVERVRLQASSGQGGWWWASREIEESKRYVPQRMLKKLAEQEAF